MTWLIDNWYIAVGFTAIGAAVGISVYRFILLPTGEKIKNVKEWLLWAVTKAEKKLGGGTGKLKLREVYDMFVERFPEVAKVIPFNIFSEWVDEALEEMRRLLETNVAVQHFVEGE